MRESQRNIEGYLARHGVGTKLVNSDEGTYLIAYASLTNVGRRMAIEIRSILDKIIGIGRIMENFQRKLLLLACKKACIHNIVVDAHDMLGYRCHCPHEALGVHKSAR